MPIAWLLAGLLALPAGAAAAPSGTLRVCDSIAEPASLSPYLVFSEKAHIIIQQMLESLVRFDSEGRIEPALAERWERQGPTRMRFFLRKGAMFHNGEPLDAEAVRYSLERYRDPAAGFPGLGFVGPLERAEVVDALTVDLVTSRPDGLLLNRLAQWGYVVPPRYHREAGDAGFSRRPVGTGPFRFVAWEAGRAVRLEANPRYWSPGRPRLARLEFVFLPVERQVEALLRGDLDLVTEMPGTATTRVASSGVAAVLKRPTFYTIGATFNTKGALGDPRVRRALNLAIDRKDLIRYDQLGNAVPLATLSMPGETGHAEGLEPYPYDPAQAKRLLAEAGHPRGLRLRAIVKSESERTARILRSQWERVGIQLDIRQADDNALLEAIRSQLPDLALGGCPDPMAHVFFITSIYLSSHSPYSLTDHPELTRMLDEAAAETDPARMEAAMQAVDRLVHKESLSLFTYQKVRTYGLRKGAVFTPAVTGMPHFFDAHAPTPNDG